MIELNIFTNCTASAPDTAIIKQTYESFIDTFGKIIPTIYIDENPHREKFNEYYKNLSMLFPDSDIIKTNSLSDGYTRAIRNGKAEYCAMLEHDWLFNNNITHSLEQITNFMSVTGCYHFRFNKRSNIIAGWDRRMDESEFMGIKYCSCNNMSNNPHIIDRKKYLADFMNIIKIVPGSKGIEEELNKHNLTTCIYGGAGYENTVTHLDGKHS